MRQHVKQKIHNIKSPTIIQQAPCARTQNMDDRFSAFIPSRGLPGPTVRTSGGAGKNHKVTQRSHHTRYYSFKNSIGLQNLTFNKSLHLVQMNIQFLKNCQFLYKREMFGKQASFQTDVIFVTFSKMYFYMPPNYFQKHFPVLDQNQVKNENTLQNHLKF